VYGGAESAGKLVALVAGVEGGLPDLQRRGNSTPWTKTCPWGPQTGGTRIFFGE
jgi:hypothetical protein